MPLNLLYAEDMENAVLAAAMLETASLNEVAGFVRPEMFYLEENQLIWRAIESLLAKNKQPDLLMVTQELAEMGKLAEVGNAYGVARKTVGVASSAHLWQHVYVVYEYYLRRSIVKCLSRKLGEAADLTQDIYEVLGNIVHDLENLQENSPMEEHLLDLKGLARTLGCPVIVACQLNRQVEQTFDHRPELKHLRESGAIEQDADLVLMLYRSGRADEGRRCSLIVAKNRHGEISPSNASIDVELF